MTWTARRRRIRVDRHRLHLFVLALLAVLLLDVRQTRIVPKTGLGLSPAQLLVLFCALAWVLLLVTRVRSRGAAPRWVWGLLLAQFAVFLVTYGRAMAQTLNEVQLGSASSGLVSAVTALLFSFLLLDALRDSSDCEVVVRWLVGAAAVGATMGITEAVTGAKVGAWVPPGLQAQAEIQNAFTRAGLDRPQGTAGVPLELGSVMVMMVPLALGMVFLTRRRGEPSWRWVLAAGLISGSGLLSLSRSVIIGLVLAVALMATAWAWRRTLLVVGLGIGGLMLAVLSGFKLFTVFVTLFATAGQDSSLASRARGRSFVVQIFLDHPLLGQGQGVYQVPPLPVLDNQYLGTLVASGIIGVLATVGVFLAALWCALRARRATEGVTAELGNALAGSIVVILLVNAILDTAGFAQISTLTPILLVLAFSLRPAARHADGTEVVPA